MRKYIYIYIYIYTKSVYLPASLGMRQFALKTFYMSQFSAGLLKMTVEVSCLGDRRFVRVASPCITCLNRLPRCLLLKAQQVVLEPNCA